MTSDPASPPPSPARQPRRRAFDDPRIPVPIRTILKLERYLRDPLVIRKMPPTWTVSALAPITPDEEAGMPPALRDYMTAAEQALVAAGFAPPLRVVDRRPRTVRSYVTLLEHARGDALCFVLVADGKHMGLTATATFRTDFADGIRMWTSNSRTPTRTPRRPGTIGLRIPDVDDVAELWALHAFRAAERARATPIAPLTRGRDPIAFQAREARETYDHWVRCGYFEPAGRDAIRHTWKGSCLAAWRGLPPWKDRIEGREARAAAALRARYAASQAGDAPPAAPDGR